MDKDKSQNATLEEITVLRTGFEIKGGDDFVYRYLFGLSKMKNCIIPHEKRQEYDKSFSPIFQNLLEAKYSKELLEELIKSHTEDIHEERDGILQGHQVNITKPIDTQLNMYFKDFFIRGVMAIDCLIRHTRHMGYGVSFLFSDDEEKFKKGIKKFPLLETDDRFVHLKEMIHHNKEGWYAEFKEIRRKIEHEGYKIPDLKYKMLDGKIIPIIPRFGNGQSMEEIIRICWENVSNLCEETLVYLISLQLKEELIVVFIPPELRNKNMPIKYAVRDKDFPEVEFTCA